MWCMCSNSSIISVWVGTDMRIKANYTSQVADTFKERIIVRCFNQYSEIIIGGTYEQTNARMRIYMCGKHEVGTN